MKAIFTLALILIMNHNATWGQTESKTTETCLFVPNNISIRCDDYNKAKI